MSNRGKQITSETINNRLLRFARQLAFLLGVLITLL